MQMCKTKTGVLFLKLLLNSGLIFTVATTIYADKDLENKNEYQINCRLSDKVIPTYYIIKLIVPDISRNNDFFYGECTIKIQVKSDTSHITLHWTELHIEDLWLSDICDTEDCDMSDFKRTNITKEWNIQTEMQTLHLSFPINISPGHYILYIKYIGDFNLYEDYEHIPEISNKELLIATDFIPIGARKLFPCLDEPRYKTPFNISIGHPKNYTIFSNMPILMYWYEKEKDIVWTHFESTPPISTSSVMMMITSFNLIALPKLHGRFDMWCIEKSEIQLQWAYNLVQLITDFFTWEMDVQDKYMMNYIVIPSIQTEITGNLGLSIHRQEDVICDTEIDPPGCRMKVERMMGRSIAYTWFGNKISPCSWSYSWLNEGLSTFFGLYAVHKTVPNSHKAMQLIVIQDQHEALHLDTHHTMWPLTSKVNSPSEIKSFFSYLHYLKAPAIIRMLQHIVTTEMFGEGIRTFYKEYQFKVVTPDHLWNILQDTLDKSHVKYGGFMLRNVMNTWTKQQYYPVVKVTRDYNNHTVMISQENINTTHRTHWWIPITYTTQTRPDFSNTFPDRWLRPSIQNLVLDGMYHDNDWIILNLQQTGYYRVNYDRTNWLLIAKYLNSENYDKIDVLNRAQIIDDAYHFLIRNELDQDIFLYIIRYLSREIDYIAWYPMFKIFEYLSNFSPFIADSAVVKIDFVNILHQLLDKLSYNIYYDDYYTTCLRQEAKKWACFFDNYRCKIKANLALQKHLYYNTVIVPGSVDWVMCNGLNIANSSTWNKYLLKEYKYFWKHLTLLHCSEVSDIIISNLHEVINSFNAGDIQGVTFMNIVYPIIMKYADNYIDHVLQIFQAFRGYNNKIKIFVIIINHVYSEDNLNLITNIVKANRLTEQMLADIQYIITTRLSHVKNRKVKISQWFRIT